jgi:hypothetical protein
MNNYSLFALFLIILTTPITSSYASTHETLSQFAYFSEEIQQLAEAIEIEEMRLNGLETAPFLRLGTMPLLLEEQIESEKTKLAYAKQQLTNKALYEALEKNSPEAVTQAFTLGANPNGVNPSNRTQSLYQRAISTNNPAIVRIFLGHKDFKINNIHTLFQQVIFRGSSKEIVDLLLATNPNIHAPNSSGETLLHNCWDPYLLEKLIALGANVNAINNKGETPLTHNIGMGIPITRAAQLITAGATVDKKFCNIVQSIQLFADASEMLELFAPFVKNPQATLTVIDQLPPEEKEEQLTQLLTYCVLGRSRPLLRIILQAAQTADRTGELRKRLNTLAMNLAQEHDIQSIRAMSLRNLTGDVVRAQLEQS